MNNLSDKTFLSNFYRIISAYKKQILSLFLLNLFSASFLLISPYISKLFIDNAFLNKNFDNFIKLSIVGVGIFLFSAFIKILSDLSKNRISIKLKLNLSKKFINKFYSLDISFFQSKSIGEDIYRLSDVNSISNFIIEQCPNLLVDIVKFVIILTVSLFINWKITTFLLFLSPLFFLQTLYLQKKLKPIYEEIWKLGAKLSKEINEMFSKILIVKILNLENYRKRIYIKNLILNLKTGLKNFKWSLAGSVSSSFLSKAVYGAITLYGGWLVIKGGVSLGSYTAVMLYLTQLGGLLESFSYNLSHFMQQSVSLKRFSEIMEKEQNIKDRADAFDLDLSKGEIKFKNINFGYSRALIFKNLSIDIPASSWIGIVGPSGCGKTTLISLLTRLYDPLSGEIYLDKFNIKDIKLKSLHKIITIVTQQPFLFDISIKDNISYGLKNINQDYIEQAAKIACVHDYIIQLPQGYDSLIGEDACKLSQGLKQRITIARAILRNPQIMILDEATSSIDSPTEEKIFMNIKSHRQGLSTIVISHRLFSIKDADSIYFLKNEGIVEKGRHGDLLSTSKTYREFFQNQISA